MKMVNEKQEKKKLTKICILEKNNYTKRVDFISYKNKND
jgi:hypothetical protein